MMSPFSVVVIREVDEFAFKIPVVPKKGVYPGEALAHIELSLLFVQVPLP